MPVLLDLYSRRIVGAEVHVTAELTTMDLIMALQQRRVGGGWLHHSDRGSQYREVSAAPRGEGNPVFDESSW